METTPKTREEWEDKFEYDLSGIFYSIPKAGYQCTENKTKVKDFIYSLLSTKAEELKEVVSKAKGRYRCGACNGAKCEHTMCCKALTDILAEIDRIMG